MELPYIRVVVLLHAAFGAVFYFLHRQHPSRFVRLMTWCWAIEGIRAAMLLPGFPDHGPAATAWYLADDLLCPVANACLLGACADVAGIRLPRWVTPAYLGLSFPLLALGRTVLGGLLAANAGLAPDRAGVLAVVCNLVVMFVPVAATRVAVTFWLAAVWLRTRLAGALIAAAFCVPYAAFAVLSPVQHYYGYHPEWIALAWSGRVLGFSVGLVMLQFSLQLAAMQHGEASLALAQANARLGSWEFSPVSGALTWSAELFRLLARPPAGGPSFAGVAPHVDPSDRPAFETHFVRAVAESGGHRGEYRLLLPDGSVRWLEARNVARTDADGALRLTGTFQDVTEKKQFEEQFLRAQRVENLGLLAAGVAHDLNNILTPILMVAPMLRERIGDEERAMLNTVEKSAERGAALAGQLLAFVHGTGGQRLAVQPRLVLREIALLIGATFPKSIHLEQSLAAQPWLIHANPTQLHQVVLNLCVNARDAMPSGGTLHLRLENRELTAEDAAATRGARPGRFVLIEVADTGSGIPPEFLTRIWEPFFTSKAPGKGTGLGLATVRGIVNAHEGFCTVRSQPGHGAVFSVFLPAAGPGDGSAADSAVPLAAPRGHGELILIVDDEESVRAAAMSLLARHGYRVLAAPDGGEGRALYRSRAGDIALVLTDWHMPDPTGEPFAVTLRREHPGQPVLVMSGLAEEAFAPFEKEGAFLPKPFKTYALLSSVHRLLRNRPTGAG